MSEVFICDAVRTPFGRFGGALATVRADDLAAIPIRALMERNAGVDWLAVDDVIYGCANQAGEDNRNVARMALLLAGMPKEVPGATVNRLCGSSMEAVSIAARAIKSGEAEMMIAGGVESMTRAPFVMGKSEKAFGREAQIYDTTIGWRFVNPLMKSKYGVDSMPETAENVAEEYHVGRQEQDAFAMRTQQRWARAHAAGFFKCEIVAVPVAQAKGEPKVFDTDEQPRPDTTMEGLQKLKPIVKAGGTVTAGNASGINDGACALLLASKVAVEKYRLTPRARVLATATAGVAPRVMGFAPSPASRKVLAKTGLQISQMDVIELNEAFAAQALAVTRDLGLPDDAALCESEWRGDCDWSSAGGERGAACDYRDVSTAEHWRAVCALYDVHWSRAGNSHDHRTLLKLLRCAVASSLFQLRMPFTTPPCERSLNLLRFRPITPNEAIWYRNSTSRKSIERYSRVFRPEFIWLIIDQKILFWNDGAERITGHLRQDVLGRFCVDDLLGNRDGHDSFATDAAEAIAAVLRDGKPVAVNVSLCHKEGHRVLVRLRAVAIRNSHGTVIGAAESFEESLSVSSWDRRQGKLAVFGCIDEESGVFNREYLLFQLRENLGTFNRYRIPFSVLCIQVDQIDHFQAAHGIRAVAAIQRAVAQTLGNSLRPTDLLGRLSERTFLAVLS